MTDIVYEPSETTHWRNLFENKSMLLGAHNLNPGEELIVEIKSINANGVIKDKKGKDTIAAIISFTNAPDMVLNVTNTQTIASLYGDYTADWIGQSIQVYATKVKAFGKEQMALRIREAKPDVNHDVTEYVDALYNCATLDELKEAFSAIPKHLKSGKTESGQLINKTKDEMKEKLCEN